MRRRRKLKIAIGGLLALIVLAVFFVWQSSFTMSAAQRINIGMSEAEVEHILGRPFLRDPLPNDTINIWWLAADGMIGIKTDARGIVLEKDAVKYGSWYERWYLMFGWPV